MRPWVPHSGWPFQKSALDAYYREAARIVLVPHFDQARDEGQQWGPGSVLTESGAFLTKQWHFSPPTRFARRYRAELAAASDARVYLHANVIGIDANEAGSGVARVRVSTLSGKQIEVRASHYVLATGGVENARLLLISDGVQQNGLGNDHDLVGRYFMEHPHKEDAGAVVLTRALADLSAYTRRGPLPGGGALPLGNASTDAWAPQLQCHAGFLRAMDCTNLRAAGRQRGVPAQPNRRGRACRASGLLRLFRSR